MKPPTFEEAVKNITDPTYGIGTPWLWQLPEDWPGTESAKVHDLRYDYLKPGESTESIDWECRESWLKEGCPIEMITLFFRIMRIWGKLFQEGEHVCALLGEHLWQTCSYGQAGMEYDLRCSRCGLHKEIDRLDF